MTATKKPETTTGAGSTSSAAKPDLSFREKLEAIRDDASIWKAEKGTAKYSYYKLQQLLDVVEPKLKEHGLYYDWQNDIADMSGRAFQITRLTISDGTDSETIQTFHELAINPGIMSSMQQSNAAMTFGQKKCFEMLLHVDEPDASDMDIKAPVKKPKDAEDYFA